MLTLLRKFSAVMIIFASFAMMDLGLVQAQTPPATDIERGITLYDQGETEAAIKVLKAVTRSTPTDADAWHYLGLAFFKEEKCNDARKAFEKALALRPNFAPSHVGLAQVYLWYNQLVLALPELRTALALDDKLALAHYLYGAASLRQANYEVAQQEADLAMKLDPKLIMAWRLKGEVLIAQFDASVDGFVYSSSEPQPRYLPEAIVALEAYLAHDQTVTNADLWRDRLATLRRYAGYFDRVIGDDPNTIYAQRELTTRAQILNKPTPNYTEAMRSRRVSGAVHLRMIFAFDAEVKEILVIGSQDPDLIKAATEAARKIRFEPATKDGRPVSQFQSIQYSFSTFE